MNGRLRDLTVNRDGSQNVTVTITSDFSEMFDELKDKDIVIDIKKASKHRSLDANAYAWALIDKIAARMHQKKTDVYLNAMRDVGGITGYVGVKEEFSRQYVDSWKRGHIGREAEILPDSGKPGWVTVKVRLGSSDLDSYQMSLLIDNLIQDAEAIGIPTITDKEAEKMLGSWAEKRAKERGE